MDTQQKQRYNFIYKCKYSKDAKYQEFIQKYLKKVLNQLSDKCTKYSFNDILEGKAKDLTFGGVYLLYAKNSKDEMVFTYVGESTNIIQRWKQHIKRFETGPDNLYKKIRKKMLKNKVKFNDINFVLLDHKDDQNERLYRETYYIYLMKSRLINVNSKNCSRRLRCPNNHGMVKSKLAPKIVKDNIKPMVLGICRNKTCKAVFEIH